MRDVYSLSLMVNPEKQAAREIERLIRYPGFLQRKHLPKAVWKSWSCGYKKAVNSAMWH